MPGDDLLQVQCECGCGVLFWVERPVRGPLRRYYSNRCRQAAWRDRIHAEAAVEAADLALATSHYRLAEALSWLSASSVTRLRDLLRNASDRNLSLDVGDGLCSAATTGVAGVVAPLHKEL